VVKERKQDVDARHKAGHDATTSARIIALDSERMRALSRLADPAMIHLTRRKRAHFARLDAKIGSLAGRGLVGLTGILLKVATWIRRQARC
jgi:hypothetical protein